VLRATTLNIHHRSLAPDSGSTTTIIAASASAGGVILVLIIFCVLWRCRRRRARTVPLPPVQPLAHVREQRLAQFVERNDAAHAATPTAFLSSSRNGSKVSLLRKEPSSSSIPSSHTSFGLSNTGPSTQSVVPSPFPDPRSQDTSIRSETATTLPETPLSFTSSSVSHNNSIGSTQYLTPGRTRSTSRSRLRSRQASTASISSTATSRSSRLIRGVPHGPHSNVQIIMPMPLAPVLDPYIDRRQHTIIEAEGNIVDKWAPKAVKRSGSLDRRSRSLDRPSSSSQSSSLRSDTLPVRAHKASSQSLSGPNIPPRRSQPEYAPPVPRIPSMYGIHTTPGLDRPHSMLQEAELRGRHRGVPTMATSRSSSNSRSRPPKELGKAAE